MVATSCVHHRGMARLLLLVPSATYRAADFLEAARTLGVEVVVGTDEAHALPGLMGLRTLEVPLDDPDAAADAIVAHDDVAPPRRRGRRRRPWAPWWRRRPSARLGLRHNPPDAVAATRDKLAMRARLAASRCPSPPSPPWPPEPGADEVAAALARRSGSRA